VRAGAKLSDSDKAKLKKMNAEIAALQTKFFPKRPERKKRGVRRGGQEEDLAGFSPPNWQRLARPRKRKRKRANLFSPCRTPPTKPP
jgi:peptidyl-dipeptidase Dcp